MTKFHKTFSSTIDWMIFFHKFESNHVFLRIRHFLFSIEFRLLIQFFSIFYFQHDSKSFRVAIVFFFCKSYRFSIKTRRVSTKIWRFDNNHKKKRFSNHFDSSTFIDDVNFTWRIWKIKMHNKIMINTNHFEISQVEIIIVIN